MRNSEPPLLRGSARRCGLIFASGACKSAISARNGSRTSRSYALWCALNHSRLLLRASARARRKVKVALEKYVLGMIDSDVGGKIVAPRFELVEYRLAYTFA